MSRQSQSAPSQIIQLGSLGLLLLFAAACGKGSAATEESVAEAIPVEVMTEHGVGDGHPATEVPIGDVTDIAVGTVARPTGASFGCHNLVVAGDGRILFSDRLNHRVAAIDAGGTIITVAGGPEARGLLILWPLGLAPDGSGGVYVADRGNHRVVWISREGGVTLIAGNGKEGRPEDGQAATEAALDTPYDVAASPSGEMYIIDGYRLYRVDTRGVISTLYRFEDAPGAIAAAPEGKILIPNMRRTKLLEVDPHAARIRPDRC